MPGATGACATTRAENNELTCGGLRLPKNLAAPHSHMPGFPFRGLSEKSLAYSDTTTPSSKVSTWPGEMLMS